MNPQRSPLPGTPAVAVALWLLALTGWAGVPLPLAGSCALAALLLAARWQLPRARTLPPESVCPGQAVLDDPASCYLGRGGPLTAQVTRALHRAADPAQGLDQGPARQRRARPVRVAPDRLQRNVLALGSPGSGKSSLLMLLAWQAQARGEAVVVIDPKGSHALRARLLAGARHAGAPFLSLDIAAAVGATRYDPLRHCQDGSACADRLCGLIGDGQHDPFRDFCWGAVAAVAEALIASGEPATLARLHRLLPDAGAPLLAAWTPADVAARADRGHRRALALANLQALVAHDRTHYRKMTAPLLPLLELLAGGARATLLSAPGPADAAINLDLRRCRSQGATVCIGLDALGQPRLSTALAWLLFDDLARLASQDWHATRRLPALQLLVDEAGEVACEPLLRLLGKGREAGLNVLLATQTLADLEWRMGGAAAAQVALGNAAAWFLFRQLDAHGRLEAEARLGNAPVLHERHSSTHGESRGRGLRQRSRSVSQGQEAVALPRVPAAAFAALRELECVAHQPEGEVLHLRLPRPALPIHGDADG